MLTDRPSTRELLEAVRLRWDLADLASCVRDLRAPHRDDEDSSTGRAALYGVHDTPTTSP